MYGGTSADSIGTLTFSGCLVNREGKASFQLMKENLDSVFTKLSLFSSEVPSDPDQLTVIGLKSKFMYFCVIILLPLREAMIEKNLDCFPTEFEGEQMCLVTYA